MQISLWILLLLSLDADSTPALQQESCEQASDRKGGFAKFKKARRFAIDEVVHGPFRISASTIRHYSLPGINEVEVFPLTRFSLGFEFLPRDEARNPGRKFDHSFRDLSMRDAFDKIVAEMPEYTWSISSGVINFYPRQTSARWDARVPEFVVNSTDIYSAGAILVTEAQRLGITLSVPNELMRDLLSYAPRITLRLSNATIRECLNAIVATDPGTRWWARVEENRLSVRISPSPKLLETAIVQKCKAAPAEYRERYLRDGFTLKNGLWVKPGPKSRNKGPTDARDSEAK